VRGARTGPATTTAVPTEPPDRPETAVHPPGRARGDPLSTCPLDGAGLPVGAVLCPGCTQRTRLALRDVPELLRELDVTISEQVTLTSTAATATCTRPGCTHGDDEPGCGQGVTLGMDSRASDARTALVHVLHGWARCWDEETPVPAPDEAIGPTHGGICRHASCWRVQRAARQDAFCALRVRMLATAAGQARLLAGVPDLAAREWAPELAREIRDAVRAAERAIDRPPDVEVVGRCQGCGTTLYAPVGAPLVECPSCGRREGREDMREASLAQARTLLPAHQLAAVLHVDPARVRQWIRRERLVPVRADMDGRPVYRIADGQALLPLADEREDATT